MQPKILGLRTTIYKVGQLPEAIAWYTRAFGIAPYFNEPFYVGLNIGGYELGLQPDEAQTGTNIATYWGVEDVDAAYRAFLELGATSFEPPQNVGGEIVVCTVKDPWGNLIGLIYNPDFKAV